MYIIMKVTLKKSPMRDKKYRVTFQDGDYVDFGGKGYTDYTIHKDPMRMRLYVLRHGGGDTRKFSDPQKVHERMLRVTKSKLEDWGISGLKTAGFWSRWLLWSEPNMRDAIRFMKTKFGLDIKYM
jgi:hypothetical protein